ncbi:LysR substrate-binding domain-containing protein [Burkholderia dolosa]|uniref:LysR substrate-binding domain-containing protein n=1 Tax=Burkholderia dolosa TaxID=152500 RepID=UPI00159109FC|nr:LysR substrate-binding domain-containing protein [Burkholderia dolosa]MBR8061017.1 LysR family transcriptional regulator [Burkholderia dolosa]MBR8303960.1 LysR family transcriptional regulator [Burkholderia dolosa]MBR8315401.1 LysR family transcriptional regulator [Burkholderia dolosa]MBR8459794.1 LysR family transcriptional regulator [Burkholderia dolosa]MBY4753790.1 LysR family transcriptional regulator [Burkholderia dolosa]
MNYRRLTPSMSLLLAFEAAARHESYTRAADELSLSQSAISRQVQTLESQLGVPLFRREGRSVKLTEVGRRYFVELGGALGRIRGATLQAMSHQAGAGTLRLATLPTFGSKWLLPHLHGFYAAHPGVTVHLHSRIGAIDFHTDDIDAAITVGAGNWPGLHAHRLYNEFLIAIASPDTAGRRAAARAPAWAIGQTLLGVTSNQHAWAEWFSHYRLDHRRMRIGPSFELTSHLIQAVRAGMGIGLVPKVLVEDELSRNELVSIGDAITSERSYYLVYPPENDTLPSLVAFRDWLLKSC